MFQIIASFGIDISRRSVATFVRCVGTFNEKFIGNLLESLSVKVCENRLAFGTVRGNSLGCLLTHDVQSIC